MNLRKLGFLIAQFFICAEKNRQPHTYVSILCASICTMEDLKLAAPKALDIACLGVKHYIFIICTVVLLKPTRERDLMKMKVRTHVK